MKDALIPRLKAVGIPAAGRKEYSASMFDSVTIATITKGAYFPIQMIPRLADIVTLLAFTLICALF